MYFLLWLKQGEMATCMMTGPCQPNSPLWHYLTQGHVITYEMRDSVSPGILSARNGPDPYQAVTSRGRTAMGKECGEQAGEELGTCPIAQVERGHYDFR